jgi:hypothetical protein
MTDFAQYGETSSDAELYFLIRIDGKLKKFRIDSVGFKSDDPTNPSWMFSRCVTYFVTGARDYEPTDDDVSFYMEQERTGF